MVDVFEESDLERLAEMQGAPCISIYIPAHEAGMEVNENMDKLSFKNEFQKVVQVLAADGYKNKEIDNLINPARELIDDLSFWKDQSKGLAVFINKDHFAYYRLPIPFKNFSTVLSRFIITPVIPAVQLRNKFFILSLNKYGFKLFQCTMAGIAEVEIDEMLRQKVVEALAPFDYKNDLYEPVTESRDPLNESRKKQILQKAKEKGDVNLPEFFRLINEIVMMKLKEEEGPLVIAGVEEWQGDYRKINKYKNIWEQGYIHNGEFLPDRELHEHVLKLLQPYFNRAQQTALLRYQAFAGTGKTSVDLPKIIVDASAGIVESLFVEKDKFIWGTVDPEKNLIALDEGPANDNYCLLNYACTYIMKNNGRVYMLEKDKMPEGSSIAAVYRY